VVFKLFRKRKVRKPMGETGKQSCAPQPTAPCIAAAIIAGRRHVTGVPYALPKDLAEVNRLDFQHYIYRNVLRGNFLVPLHESAAILDVAAGTGIWGKEMAQQFPQARVVGLDLENIKKSGQVPPNYEFVRGNLLERLPFRDNAFDLVHQRLVLASAVPFERWMDVFKEFLRVTRPGGWLELAEVGVEVNPPGPLTRHFFEWGIEASKPRGLCPREIPRIDHYLSEAGAINVGSRYHDVPMGSWGGHIGTMMETNLLSAFQGLKALYTERGSAEEFDRLLMQLPDEWRSLRSYIRFFVFWCQKEMDGGSYR
jgi:ubiquinone/menaquinone biosynthesis C-methylase UbiE